MSRVFPRFQVFVGWGAWCQATLLLLSSSVRMEGEADLETCGRSCLAPPVLLCPTIRIRVETAVCSTKKHDWCVRSLSASPGEPAPPPLSSLLMRPPVEQGHTEWVSCVRFSPSPSAPVIVSAGWDKLVKVWALSNCKLHTNLIGHTG